MNIIEKITDFLLSGVVGLLVGLFVLGVTVFGNNLLISKDFICTKYDFVGKTPDRYETCVEYKLPKES